jgi:hypothetical protein
MAINKRFVCQYLKHYHLPILKKAQKLKKKLNTSHFVLQSLKSARRREIFIYFFFFRRRREREVRKSSRTRTYIHFNQYMLSAKSYQFLHQSTDS